MTKVKTDPERSKTFSIVVPVFNNEATLPALLEALSEVRTALKQRGLVLQVLFVDDGSKDHSFQMLAQRHFAEHDIEVIKLTRNFGAISALKTTIDKIQGEAFVFLAADAQDPPDLIPQMVDRWLEGNKYVVAIRRRREDTWSANIFANVYYWFLSKFITDKYPKNGFDLALMDKQFIPYLRSTGKHVNFPLFPFWLGFTPSFLEYERKKIPGKKSSWTFVKKFNLAIDSLLSLSRAPTRVLFFIGALLSAISFIYSAVVLISALAGKVEVPGFATTVILMSLFNGVIIIFLGMVTEYLWRIFDEVNGHPVAVVDFMLMAENDTPTETIDE